MAVSTAYKEFVLDILSNVDGVSCRSMFGGAGLYIHDTMFGLVSSEDRFYLRVDEVNQPDFEAQEADQFAPHAKKRDQKPIKMPYFEVPPEILDDEEEMAIWAKRAWEAAMRNKKPKKKKKR